jgi:hypothetical protein
MWRVARALLEASKRTLELTLAKWQLVHAIRVRGGLRVAEDDAVGGSDASAAVAVFW